MTNENIKILILKKLHQVLDEKIETINQAIASAKGARDSDTKSSAGDKYETGRAMMQIEIDNNNVQLNKTLQLKRELSSINANTEKDHVGYGSLVITSQGNYFLSIGLGKISVEKQDYYTISLASPIGKLLHSRTVGEKFLFQKREFIVQEII
ncbi:MAG: 3-oxoacyl-ACP synthase [Bacteroidota bacterium]